LQPRKKREPQAFDAHLVYFDGLIADRPTVLIESKLAGKLNLATLKAALFQHT
jgi:hypothetical protein